MRTLAAQRSGTRRFAARINAGKAEVSRSQTIPAPVEGWDASSPLAAMSPKRAVELVNWFPQPGWIEVRKGCRYQSWDLGSGAKTITTVDDTNDDLEVTAHGFVNGDVVKVHASSTMPGGLSATRTYYVVNATANDFQLATTSGGTAIDITSAGSGTVTVFKLTEPPVQSLMSWHGPGATSKLFAAAGGSIWDVTSISHASFSTGNGLGSDRWQSTNFATSGGNFLFCVNGVSPPRYFDGSSWTVPAIDGTGIDENLFVTVTAHKARLWFAIAGSTDAAYLPTQSIAGTAAKFPLGPLFSRGGQLRAVESWTMDGGSGPDDYLAFISSRGQVALYSGTDPSDASTWSLVGVFDIGDPIGRRCTLKYGTSPLIITNSGLLQLKLSLGQDQSQLEGVAFTARIYQAMTDAARSYGTLFGWDVTSYPRGNMLVMNVPTAENSTAVQYVQNTLTGAWCQFQGWNANCFHVHSGKLYYGGQSGDVYEADIGATDDAETIVATGQTAYSSFGNAGTNKRFSLLKAMLRSTAINRPQLGISTDFVETAQLTTLPAAISAGGALWDTAKWDQSVWSGDDVNVSDWASLEALGVYGSIKFVGQTGSDVGGALWGVAQWGQSEWGGSTASETLQINGFVCVYEPGGHL